MTSLNISIRTPEDNGDGAVASYTEGYTFVINNEETFPFSFKAFTQQPELYTFTPAFGIVMGNAKVSVTIRLRVPAFYIHNLEGNADVTRYTSAATNAEEERRQIKRKLRQSQVSSEGGDHSPSDSDLSATASEGDFSGDEEDGISKLTPRNKSKKAKSGSSSSSKKKNRRERTESITGYMKTQISSGVFKVELRVVNTPIGAGVAETVFLTRQHPIEYIARKDLQRRDKQRFLEQMTKEFNNNNSSSSAAAGSNASSAASLGGSPNTNSPSITSNPMPLLFYDKTKFRPSSAEISATIARIRKNAHSLFDHLWSHAIPHSTHTICCRTMKEDLHSFFAKIISFQEKDIEALQIKEKEVAEAVAKLSSELGSVSNQVGVYERRFKLRQHGIPEHLIDSCIQLAANNTKSGDANVSLSSTPAMDAELNELVALLGLDTSLVAPSNSKKHATSTKKPFSSSSFPKLHLPYWLVLFAGVASFGAAFQSPNPIPTPKEWLIGESGICGGM